jgi:hypothetical protein
MQVGFFDRLRNLTPGNNYVRLLNIKHRHETGGMSKNNGQAGLLIFTIFCRSRA